LFDGVPDLAGRREGGHRSAQGTLPAAEHPEQIAMPVRYGMERSRRLEGQCQLARGNRQAIHPVLAGDVQSAGQFRQAVGIGNGDWQLQPARRPGLQMALVIEADEDELLLEDEDELEELLDEELDELETPDDEDELDEEDDEELELLEDDELDDDAAVTVSEAALLRVKPGSLVTVTEYAPASAAWALMIVSVALVPPGTGVL